MSAVTQVLKKRRWRSELNVLDLELDVPSQLEGDHFPLLTEIRAGEDDIVDEITGLSVSFGIKEAYLKLDLKGCDVVMGRRDGDATIEEGDIETSKVRERRHSESSGSLSGSSSIAPKSIGATFGAEGKIETSKMREEESETERRKIVRRRTAISSERWRYNVIDEDYLVGRIQSSDESICSVSVSEGNFSVRGTVDFWATGRNVVLRDIRHKGHDADFTDKLLSIINGDSNARKKAIELIIAKGLKPLGGYVEVERYLLEGKRDNE